jgi:tetratricopeptide (TPR) repeat protein
MLRWLIVVPVLIFLITGCGGEPDYLQLAWQEFDQNPDRGWRPVAQAGDYAGAAAMIENYLAHHTDLPDAQRGYSTLHAGQLLALDGEVERAMVYYERAAVVDMPPDFPPTFNSLVTGELSFLRGDMAGLRAALDQAVAMPGLTRRDSLFIQALEVLAASEGKTFRQVFDEARGE